MFVNEDLSALSKEQLEQELAAHAAHVDAGLCRLVELAAECKRRLNWGSDGVTFARWLSWRCALSPRQAREHERVGEALAGLPLTREAFARGELSYSKVRVLTRIADAESEAELLELAEALTASQLARVAGAFRRISREEASELQQREFFDYQWGDDGSLALRGRLAAEEGAVVLRALDAGREALWERRKVDAGDEFVPAVGEVPARPSNAEALVAAADLALAHAGRERSCAERHQVVIHVDAATLADDCEGRCELDDGHALAAETARRLSCDGSIVELLERDGEPLSLGRKRRTVSVALRRALAARDRGCRFPGCDNTRFVDAHHVEHWCRGGGTSLDNLLSLCRRHHRLVHERGYTVELGDDGEALFRNHYGIAIPNAPPRPPPSEPRALHNHHRGLGLTIDDRTCRCGYGDRMDLGLAVAGVIAITAAPAAAA
jgi:hypothetical protein